MLTPLTFKSNLETQIKPKPFLLLYQSAVQECHHIFPHKEPIDTKLCFCPITSATITLTSTYRMKTPGCSVCQKAAQQSQSEACGGLCWGPMYNKQGSLYFSRTLNPFFEGRVYSNMKLYIHLGLLSLK